jgi:hypothetical protein
MRTHILERTRDFFTRRPDERCSGAARLVPTDSRAAPLRPATSTAALRSPDCSWADLPTPAMAGVSPWPPPAARVTCTSGAPPPRIINDWRCHEAVPKSGSYGTLGVGAESLDLARHRRLCKEFASGWSEPSKRWRDGVVLSSDYLSGSAR